MGKKKDRKAKADQATKGRSAKTAGLAEEIRSLAMGDAPGIGDAEREELLRIAEQIEAMGEGTGDGCGSGDVADGTAEDTKEDVVEKAGDAAEDADADAGTDADAGFWDGPIPIVPISHVLTEAAARRLIDGDGGRQDALGRSMRIRQAIRGTVGEVAPKFVTDGLERVSARAIHRLSDASTAVRQARQVRLSGYSDEEVSLLGVSFLRRLAGMLSDIARITADADMRQAAKAISSCVDWHEDGYGEMAALLGHEAATRTGMRMRAAFDEAWEWVYEHVFADGRHAEEPAFRRLFWEDEAEQRELVPADRAEGVLRDAGNAFLGLPTIADLKALPHAELGRLSDMLREFAETATSWPEVYPDRPLLSDTGDEWPGSQYWDLLGGIRTGDVQGSREKVVETDDGGTERTYYRAKTNEQMGTRFASWTQDCHDASKVLGYWASDNAGDKSARTVRSVMTDDERAEVARQRRDAWDWLGRYAFCMAR